MEKRKRRKRRRKMSSVCFDEAGRRIQSMLRVVLSPESTSINYRKYLPNGQEQAREEREDSDSGLDWDSRSQRLVVKVLFRPLQVWLGLSSKDPLCQTTYTEKNPRHSAERARKTANLIASPPPSRVQLSLSSPSCALNPPRPGMQNLSDQRRPAGQRERRVGVGR